MKNAVMIVPIPTSPVIRRNVNPADKQRRMPHSTQKSFVMTRPIGKGIRFCFSDQISATAL